MLSSYYILYKKVYTYWDCSFIFFYKSISIIKSIKKNKQKAEKKIIKERLNIIPFFCYLQSFMTTSQNR